jgi:HrpA-like RNA helicase
VTVTGLHHGSSLGSAQVFENVGRGSRKVVVATNIAETSVTIDGARSRAVCGRAQPDRQTRCGVCD